MSKVAMICFKKLTSFSLGFFIFLCLGFLLCLDEASAQTPPPIAAKKESKVETVLAKFFHDKYLAILNQGFESPDDLIALFYNESLLTLSRTANDENNNPLTRIDVLRSKNKSASPAAEKLFFYNKQKKLAAILERDSKTSHQNKMLSLDEKINALKNQDAINPVLYPSSPSDLLFGPRRLYSFTWSGDKLSNYSFLLINGGRGQKIFSYNYTYQLSRIDKIKNVIGVLAEYRLRRGIDENKEQLGAYLKKNKLAADSEKDILSTAEKYADDPSNHYYIEAVPGSYDELIDTPINAEGIKILSHPSPFSPTYISTNLESLFNAIDSKKTHQDITDDRYYFTYEYDTDKRISSITFSRMSKIDGRKETVNSVSYYFIYQLNNEGSLDKIDIYKKNLLKPGKKEAWIETWKLNYNTKDSLIAPIDENVHKILTGQKIDLQELVISPVTPTPIPVTPSSSPLEVTPSTPPTPSKAAAPILPVDAKKEEEVPKVELPISSQAPPPSTSSLPPGKASEIQEETQ